MKSFYLPRVVVLVFFFLGFSTLSHSQGIFGSYVTLDYNGNLEYFKGGQSYNAPGKPLDLFDGQYLGTFSGEDVFELAGADVHTFKNIGAAQDVFGAELNYRIYELGGVAPSFTSQALGFCCNANEQVCLDLEGICDTGGGIGDQKWYLDDLGLNILNGLKSGDYVLEVFFKAYTTAGDQFDSNSGNNFKATFTVGTEGFLDEDLSTGTVWSGELNNWSVLNPDLTSGSGGNTNINGSTVRNNEVLVSNGNVPSTILTTPSNMAYGTWQFSLATGSQWETTANNGVRVYLTSNTSDVNRLKAGLDDNPDFQGYMLKLGGPGTDTFEIVKVDGSTETVVVASTFPDTPHLLNGVRVKVTRDRFGNWELFGEAGFDGPSPTTSAGTGFDNEFTTSSFFGIGTALQNPSDLRRLYFDNLTFIPNTIVSFTSTTLEAEEADGDVILEVSIEVPSETEATTVEVALIGGDTDRIGAYSTQTLIFPPGVSESELVLVDILDNNDCDGDAFVEFQLQNVSGGTDAVLGKSEAELIINDNNSTLELTLEEDFEDGGLAEWGGEVANWLNSEDSNLPFSRALFSDAENTLTGNTYVTYPNQAKDLQGGITIWNFSAATGAKDPNRENRFMIHLTSNSSDVNDAEIDGYAVGINAIKDEFGSQDVSDAIKLYKITNGLAEDLIEYSFPSGWQSSDEMEILVVRDEAGLWELYINNTIGSGNFEFVGDIIDETYEFAGDFIVASYKGFDDSANWINWSLSVDDISITQDFCSDTYETVDTGEPGEAIWVLEGTNTPATPPFNKLTDIIVKDGDILTLTNNIRVGELTLESGAELNLGEEGYDLEIMKDFYIEGTIIPNKGSLTMGGTDGVQGVVSFITPNFYEFNVENPNGVDFLTDANFYGPIHAELGTLEFETGANIILASDAFDFGDGEEVLTGSISTIKEEADVVGEITMQRYVENFEEGYRIMAVPTLNQTVESAFDGDFLLTGFPGSDFPGQPYTNIKYYNETAAGNVNFGFIDVQSMDEAIDADKAYWGYFPPETSNYVLDASGDFRKGDVTINLSYTDTGDPLNDGWNCIPNPFPSSVDMSSDQIELVNCQRAAYILDHTLGEEWTGEYVSWVDGVANNGGSNILSSYQGFFIQATGPNASITFKEGCKVDDQADFFRYEDQTRQIIRFTLNDEDFGYETTISFHPEGTSNFDSQFDGGFITTTVLDQGIVSLSSQLNGMSYAINTIGELTEPVSITLRATIPEAGEYALKLKDVDNMIESACIVVEDTETGTFTTMEEGTVIPFTTTENAYETERFIVHFYPGATHETQMVSCYNAQDGLVTLNTPAYGDWAVSWTDQNGNLVSSEDQSDSSVISDLASGVYTAVMTSGEADYCNALTQEVAVFEPAQEEVTYFSEMSYCSNETGEVAVAVSNANQWTVAVFSDGEFISEASGNGMVALNGLAGELYTVQVNSECTSEEYTVDLRDPNEVTAELEAASELELEGVLVPFTAVNFSQNALYTEWYLDGTLVSEAEDLNLEFSEDGAYIITLISSNQQCSDETTHYLLVSSTNSIIEESLSYAILNGDNQITIQFNGLISGGELDVIDAHGKLVYSQVLNSTAEIILNTSDFAEGIYMISLSHDGEQRFTEKFMK